MIDFKTFKNKINGQRFAASKPYQSLAKYIYPTREPFDSRESVKSFGAAVGPYNKSTTFRKNTRNNSMSAFEVLEWDENESRATREKSSSNLRSFEHANLSYRSNNAKETLNWP